MGNGLKKLVKEPIAFVKQPSFKWIAFVYSGTYVAANLTQVFCETKGVVSSFVFVCWFFPDFAVREISCTIVGGLTGLMFVI